MDNWEGRNSDHLVIKLGMSEEVQAVLKKRHLQPEEIQFAIFHGEEANDKLYDAEDPNHFLVKCVVGLGLYHVEYRLKTENGEKLYEVVTAYACSTMIKQ